jgi:hypothetical protein
MVACGSTKTTRESEPLRLELPEEQDASRADLVSAADEIAVQASVKKGEEAAEAFARAARLRQASYRTFGKHVDALEAMELWSEAADRSETKACDYGIELANLRAQVGANPDEQYRDYYLLRERFQGGACHHRLERGLALLGVYRPSPDELRNLRVSAEKRGKALGPALAPHFELLDCRGRTLEVQADSPAWSQELAIRQVDVLARLAERLGRDAPTEIRLRVR